MTRSITTPDGTGQTDRRGGRRDGRRALVLDLAVVLSAVLVVVAAALVGWRLIRQGVELFMWFPPLIAGWDPKIGPGSVFAVLIAAAVVVYGPVLADRLRWRVLLPLTWLAGTAWTFCLAMVNGFEDGIATRLTSSKEYLNDVPRIDDIGEMLRQFAGNILTGQPESWSMHVGAHPPGALLTFVWLDRLGLGGGAAAGLFCIAVGASAGVAVIVALRALGAEPAARAAAPFVAVFPGAVWVGVSGDGMFAGFLAWGVALLAVGATRRDRSGALFALAGGLLLGYTLYLSYGLVLGGALALAVIVYTRSVRALLFAALGVGLVVAAFTLSGFWWLTGFDSLQVVYAESVAKTRPYSYFVWANLAALCFVLGPAALAGIRRGIANPKVAPALSVIAGAALLAVLLADATGMSKGEVERIWLPFGIWLTASCALLPRGQIRGWLAAHAVLGLLVEHLLFTPW